MKGFSKKFEQIFMAAAFAEAGEFETAREIMREQPRDQKRDTRVERKTARISAPGAKR
jgi:thioredoxin-like negative regulator of GroEL